MAMVTVTTARTHLETVQRQREQGSADLTAATTAAAQVDAERLRVHQLNEAYADAVALARLRQDLRDLLTELAQQAMAIQTADATYQAADAALQEAQRRWEAGQAVVLAQRLVDGAPCPVCGAHHHPAPAIGHGEIPIDAELQQLRGVLHATQSQLATAQAAQQRRQARHETLAQQIQDLERRLTSWADHSPVALHAHLAAAKASYGRARQAADSLEQLRAQHNTFEHAVMVATQQHTEARQAGDALEHERSQLQGQLVPTNPSSPRRTATPHR